jgi:RES domain-containing protein
MPHPYKDHPDYENLETALSRLVEQKLLRPWSGIIYRFCKQRYAKSEDLLSGLGAKRYGGRFGRPGGFPIVYGSTSAELALRESEENFRKAGIELWEACPLVVASIMVRLTRVIDMCDPVSAKTMEVSTEAIRSDSWKTANDAGQESLSQALGRAAHHLQVQALLVPSRLHPSDSNLVLFRDHIRDDEMKIMED